MAGDGLSAFDPVASLLGDLDTITTLAQTSSAASAQPALVPGEVRPAAILLVDIVGFTPLAEVLGAEALSHLTDRCFRIFELAVQSHGGYCDKLIGDAGLYVFPGHISYEPPCQGALRSALEIQRRVGQVNQSLSATGLELALRCGVSFGEVTRQRIGGAGQQFTVLGPAVNLAQRLESNAPPGGVCTSREVLDETGALFDYEPLGPRQLKGIGERDLYHVTAEKPRDVRLRGRGQISPLVGREELLEEAAGVVREWLAVGAKPASPSALVQTTGNTGEAGFAPATGRLLVLRGPTAVGKSRLAWELTKLIGTEAPLALATAHCTPHGGLLGFAAELCKVAGLTADNVAERWAELVGATGRSPAGNVEIGAADLPIAPTSDFAQHLPLLAYVLGSRAIDTSAIRQGDGAAFGAACKGALAACLELAAREGRMPLLVVEDVQWLGDLADVLAHLLGCELPRPLVVVATARTAAEDEQLLALVSRSRDTGGPAGDTSQDTGDGARATERLRVIEVAPLTREQGSRLLDKLLPGADLPEALVTELHEKSLGLPYYYEEAARLLLRRGVVAAVGASGSSPARADEPNTGDLPVAPTTFTVTGSLDSVPIPDDLRTLILGRLDTLPPQLRELAQHASVLGRSFALDDLLKLEEKLGALDCAQVCGGLGELQSERILHPDLDGPVDPDGNVRAEVVSARSDESSAGVPLTTAGGDKLPPYASSSATTSPRYFFTHVLTQEAAYSSLLSVNRRQLHSAAGDILAAAHVPGTAAEWDLLPKLFEHFRAATDFAGATRVACDMSMLLARTNRTEQARVWLEHAESVATNPRAQEKETAVRLIWARGVAACYRKEHTSAQDLLEAAVLLAQEVGNTYLQVCTLLDLALVNREVNDLPLAEGFLQEALQLAQEHDYPALLQRITLALGWLYKRQGHIDRAISNFESAVELLRGGSNYRSLALGLNSLGSCLVDRNEVDRALTVFNEGRIAATRSGDKMLEVSICGNTAVALESTQPEDALRAYQEALRMCIEISFRDGAAFNRMNIGDLLLKLDRPNEAETSLQEALRDYEVTGEQWGAALALGTLAETQIRLNKLEEARDALCRAEALFEEYGDQFRRGLMQCSWVRYHLACGDVRAARGALMRAQALRQQSKTSQGSVLHSEIARAQAQLREATVTAYQA